MIWWLLCALWPRVAADNETQPISIFRSRPDLVAPILTNIDPERFHRPDKVAPGLYFISPYQSNLVFSGFGAAGPGISHSPQVCDYNGEPHLCFYQGTQLIGWGHGHGIIMDKHYRIVKSVEPSGSYQASSDMHEFMLIDGGRRALLTQYLRSVHNLCEYDICYGLGYVQQGAFQEIEVDTNKVIFQWKSLDHIGLDESHVLPSSTEISGSGEQPESPWDYFHINSIDKNADGDYLISARHVSAIYKISGNDGHVIWRLNGARSDYQLVDFDFGFQHDARFISDNKDETVISIFDNASNGFTQTAPHSAGIEVKLDHRQKMAYVLKRYEPPRTRAGGMHVSRSQGNFQRLPNNNLILGWGNDAFWTEYTDDGEIVFYGHVGIANTMNYRVHKFNNWVGLPLTKPALWTYSRLGGRDHPMYCYVSWNGATEVKYWRFFYSDSKSGPWTNGPETGKNGFETVVKLPSSPRYTYVEALDKDRQVLGTGEVQETYVPTEELRPYCDDLACKFMPIGEELDNLRKAKHNGSFEMPPQTVDDIGNDVVDDKPPLRDAPNVRLLVAGSSAVGGIVLLMVVYSLRHYISPAVGRIRLHVADIIGGKRLGTYKEMASYEHEDESVPMRPTDDAYR